METLLKNMYEDGEYLRNRPTWHEEDAPFKAKYIYELLKSNNVDFSNIAEVGCGTGGVIRNLNKMLVDNDKKWSGFDVSSQAISIAQESAQRDDIEFSKIDLYDIEDHFDVLLCIDVFEHVPDYLGFIRECRSKSTYVVYHIPLDLHVSSALRDSFLSVREAIGHLHYFSRSTALASLEDTGHTILDTMLTPGALELAKLHPSIKRSIANIPRRAVGTFSQNASSRLFGGYSLLALTK